MLTWEPQKVIYMGNAKRVSLFSGDPQPGCLSGIPFDKLQLGLILGLTKIIYIKVKDLVESKPMEAAVGNSLELSV